MEKENVGRKKSSKLNNSAALIFHTLEYAYKMRSSEVGYVFVSQKI